MLHGKSWISSNSLFGKIPEFIRKWNNLDSLRIQASGLEGPIPSSITLLRTLTHLRISDLNGPDTIRPPFINTSFKNLQVELLFLVVCD
nr:probable leucine-rich repeat receptor-like serine/threonine-protein kinase At3g14840 [Tanacetum cinerariifolium]